MVKYIFLLILLFDNICDSNDELEISAEQFTYDKDNTRIYATGDVKIIDNQFKLNADKVFLNNSTNVLSARDNVTIFIRLTSLTSANLRDISEISIRKISAIAIKNINSIDFKYCIAKYLL